MKVIQQFLTEQAQPVHTKPIVTKVIVDKRNVQICPHCNQEIVEKSMMARKIGTSYHFFHRPCKDKAPIKIVTDGDVNDAMDKMKCRSSLYGP